MSSISSDRWVFLANSRGVVLSIVRNVHNGYLGDIEDAIILYRHGHYENVASLLPAIFTDPK